MTLVCHHCRNTVEPPTGSVQRTDSCPSCYSDLKCCLNCAFHDPGRDNQCSDPAAEWVPDKSKANFCEFFAPPNKPAARPDARSDARSAFDSLFKK
jgi:hypothetical protein